MIFVPTKRTIRAYQKSRDLFFHSRRNPLAVRLSIKIVINLRLCVEEYFLSDSSKRAIRIVKLVGVSQSSQKMFQVDGAYYRTTVQTYPVHYQEKIWVTTCQVSHTTTVGFAV
jgi:hypothetical protein